MARSNKELEAKFYLVNLKQLEETLVESGANLIQPRTYERNLRFDTPEGVLNQSAQVLRLRQETQPHGGAPFHGTPKHDPNSGAAGPRTPGAAGAAGNPGPGAQA